MKPSLDLGTQTKLDMQKVVKFSPGRTIGYERSFVPKLASKDYTRMLFCQKSSLRSVPK